MNIRGTDPTALAAVTDLFVARAPSRDGGAGGFQQALQPPRPYEPSPSAAPRQDLNTPQRKAPEAPREEDASCRREVCRGPESTSETAETETSAEQTAPVAEEVGEQTATEPPTNEESTDDQNVAAESIAAATVVVTEQQLPEKQLPAVANELVATGPSSVEGESASPTANEQGLVTEPSQEKLVTNQQVATTVVTESAVAATKVDCIPELPADGVAEDASKPVSGSGVLPAIAPQATNNATRNTPSRTRAASSGTEKVQQVRSSDQAIQAESPQETAPGTATSAIVAGALQNSDDDSDAAAKKGDQPLFAVDNSPVQQPTEVPAQAETKIEPVAGVEAPVASELNSTHHPAHDPTKLTTTQPLANAAINRLPAQALVRGTPQQQAPALHVDAARFLQRVTKAFESARERGGEIRLRLSPPELGALRVEVNMSEHGLAARVEVETNDARTVLLENLPALRERLAEQGLRLEKFDVDLAKREPDQNGGQLPDQPRDRQSQSEARTVRNAVPRPSALPTTQPEITPSTGWQDRQLNVIV